MRFEDSSRRPFSRPETGLQVSEDVVDVLQSHRQTHQTGGNSGGELLLGRELRVCRRSRVDNQASHVTNVGDVAKRRDVVDQCATGSTPPLISEGQHCSDSVGAYFEAAACHGLEGNAA